MTDDRVFYRADDPGGTPMVVLPSWLRYWVGIAGMVSAIAALVFEFDRQFASGEQGVTLFAALAMALGLISTLYAMEAMQDAE